MAEQLPVHMIAAEWERLILANILDNTKVAGDFVGMLERDDFAIEHHRRVWGKIAQVHNAGTEPGLAAVARAFHDDGDLGAVNGLSGLLAIEEQCVPLHDPGQWVRLLRRLSVQRRIYQLGAALQSDPDGHMDNLRTLERELEALEAGPSPEHGTIADAITEIGGIEALFRKPKDTVPFPHANMNTTSNGGIEPDTLWLLAARPSTGKSVLACEVALGAARRIGPVHLYSLEMGKRKLLLRLVAHETGIPLSYLVGGYLNDAERGLVRRTLAEMDSLPLEIFSKLMRLADIRERILRDRPRLAIIDYLGLIESGGRHESRNQEVSALSRALKLIPQQHGIPVLVLSQLSRGGENSGKPRQPVLSDLRDSGSLEQDADGVIFLHDPDAGQQVKKAGGMVDVVFAKQRDGVRDSWMSLKFDAPCVRFREITQEETQ